MDPMRALFTRVTIRAAQCQGLKHPQPSPNCVDRGVVAARQKRSISGDAKARRKATADAELERRRQSGRLSKFWAPTHTYKDIAEGEKNNDESLLFRAGFIRQASAGIFHFLPLGLRVQTKIENLIDKHMESIGAIKLALSNITTEELWKKSGRFDADGKGQPEMFRVRNSTNEGRWLLGPTHEEEITQLASTTMRTYRDVPLRLYQITRKFRHELRPRQGLLRGREFVMKDLYTFDATATAALETYHTVKAAYSSLFAELQIPYFVAEADSGSMGGRLSHEFHYASTLGEDMLLTCDTCGWQINEERATMDRGHLVTAGRPCPSCHEGTVTARRAVELGHTFLLGTRYSVPLNAVVTPAEPNAPPEPLHMGCHGIGVSRLVGAAAAVLADARGLNWPRAIAPFELVVIPQDWSDTEWTQASEDVYKRLLDAGFDAALDDRDTKRFRMSWKMKDADMIGYPVVIIVSKRSLEAGGVEVQCRRLEYKKNHSLEGDELANVVEGLLNQL